jgi:hypothetical protein
VRCRHCYADIREAVITEGDWQESWSRPLDSAWLTEETRSPFCLRVPCWSESHGSTTHEIRHEPMPTV